MNISTDPTYYRSEGLKSLEKGKQLFNSSDDLSVKQKGYEIFKNGISYMVQYAKGIISNIFNNP